ncbi:MAG TPA: NfeD family protein [Defluviitoga sp.]|nr:NfeD family protein [Defluviitoga sp.]HOP23796.1 NfeD family protein [Defluviitoga sp.]HPZ28457.1 NfeD family protein [Defluviitoga sp.]HQD62809.1 NfeD family protein [Defluviitoga sp.]
MGQWGLWVIFAVIFAIAEAMTPTFFFLWFAIGAGVAAITSLFIASVSWNLVIFLLVSFTLWLSTRKLVKKLYKNAADLKTFQEQIVGKKGKVIKVDEDGEKIVVKINGDTWRAYPDEYEEEKLKEDDEVFITRKSGNFVYVKKIRPNDNEKQ